MPDYMKKAIEQAKKAYAEGEVPVGCIIVKDGVIISRGRNQIEKKKSVLAHAELLAIAKAEKKLNSRRLSGCTMYVTLEPCPMCAGAIMNSRIDKVVFGAFDENTDSLASKHIFKDGILNHNIEVKGGVMADECSAIIKKFFRERRAMPKFVKSE